jgi:hypothetical protein
MVQLSLSDDIVKEIIGNPVLLSSSDFPGLSSDELVFILNKGYISGFRLIFILNASLSAFALVTSLLLIKPANLIREDDSQRLEAAKDVLPTVNPQLESSASTICTENHWSHNPLDHNKSY